MFQSPIGVLYISIMVMEMQVLLRQMFPSPIGVLYISIIHNRLTYTNCIEFQSPIGVLYISMDKKTTYDIQLSVSVPYWGSLYFNALCFL